VEQVYERCCGLDVHKKSITACAWTPEGKEFREFGTMTGEILELVEWIRAKGCTHVAMESTGVYWKPIYNLLEASKITALVVNAQHIKNVPGRKTDMNDAEWIAKLLKHGLLQGSFIPEREQRELRELVRYRRSLLEERTREVNRLQKVLEGANIKLASVLSNVVGVSGRQMLNSLVNGTDNPQLVSTLAKGKLKKKKGQIEQSLRGLIGPHQRMMIKAQLEHIDFLDRQIGELDREIAERTRPFKEVLELLDTIPGVGRRTAEQVVAEIGVNMDRFPTAAHLASWAGMSPGNNESAGKKKSARTRKGNKFLRSSLVEAGQAAGRTKDTYLSAKFSRIAARRGSKRAAVALGHKILVMAYHMIKTRKPYEEKGAAYAFRSRSVNPKRLIQQLQALGYEVRKEDTHAAD